VGGLRDITLTGDTFAENAVLQAAVSVTNVPVGLIPVFVRSSDTVVTLAFEGMAINHADTDDTYNVSVVFGDEAFTNELAATVSGSNINVGGIDFTDPSSIHFTGHLFESDFNDGSVTGARVITLIGDTFVSDTALQAAITTNHIPLGLTPVFTRTSDTVVTLTFEGNASDHSGDNDESDIAVAFGDGAFTHEAALAVAGNINNATGIDFIGPSVIRFTGGFSESSTNEGNVAGARVITLTGDTFSENDVLQTAITPTNVPEGLTPVFIRSSDAVVTLTFAGSATNHANADDLSNIEVAFSNAAFVNETADIVVGSINVATQIDFTDASSVTFTGSLAESNDNDGSVTGFRDITLTGDTFVADDVLQTAITATNVPIGLTPVFVRTSDTVVNLTFTGNATNHSDANDISDIGVAFGDAAFVNETASSVSGSNNTGTSIDFIAVLPIIDTIATDDIVNAFEQASVITGTVEEGSVVKLSLGGHERLATITGAGTTWSYTLLHTDITAMGQGVQNILAIATDTGGVEIVSEAKVITIDTLAPTVDISLTDSAIKVGDIATVTFTFSEAPIGFDTTDINADNGTISELVLSEDNDRIYTALYTPVSGITDTINVITVGGGYTDIAGNHTHQIIVNSNAATLSGGENNNWTFGNAPSDSSSGVTIDKEALAGDFTISFITPSVVGSPILRFGLSSHSTGNYVDLDYGLSFRADGSTNNVFIGGSGVGFTISGNDKLEISRIGSTVTLKQNDVVLDTAVGSGDDLYLKMGVFSVGATFGNVLLNDLPLVNLPEARSANYAIDTVAPAPPTIHAISTDDVISLAENGEGFNVTGTGEARAIITVGGFLHGVADKTALVAVDGTWTMAIVTADVASGGPYTLFATQTDVALNTSASATRVLTVDLNAPNTATLSSTNLSMNSAQAHAGIDLFNGINSPHSPDIIAVKVTIAGAELDTVSDHIILNVTLDISSDYANATAASLGGVSVTYSYTALTGVLLIHKENDTVFTRNEITSLVQAVKLMTTSTMDGDRTFVLQYEDLAGNTSAAATVTVTGTDLGVSAIYNTVTITGISEDTGVGNDYITSDNNGLSLTGTLSQALGENALLEYYDGASWLDISSSLGAAPALSFAYTDTGLLSDATVKLRVRNTVTNAQSAIVEQAITIDVSAPSVDLSSNIGVQNMATTQVTVAQASSGLVVFSDIQEITANDIRSIEITMGGAVASNDLIELDVANYIDSSIANAVDVAIGGVTGVNYSYDLPTKTLTFTKNGGGVFSSEHIDQIQSAIKYKSTSNVDGGRTFTLTYIDVAGNVGSGATQTVQLDTAIPNISSASVVLSTSVIGYKAVAVSNIFGDNSLVLNRYEQIDISSYIPAGMTATEFLNALIGFKATWGGAGISGVNTLSNSVVYQGMSEVASNEAIWVYLATTHIKSLDLRFIVSGDELMIRNQFSGWRDNAVPYQEPTENTHLGYYGLGDFELFYEVELSVADNAPDINVIFDGVDAKVGDRIQLLEASDVLVTYTITASDIGAGIQTVTLSSDISLPEGVHNLDVKYIDTAGNVTILSSGVEFAASAPAGQETNMKITGIRSANAGEDEADQLLGADNYLSSSAYTVTFLGVQDTASFIVITVGDQLLYDAEVAAGAFELSHYANWGFAPGIHEVVVKSTNTSNGIVNTQIFDMGWFSGSFVTDIITGSNHDDHIMPKATKATDVITTHDGRDIVYLANKQLNGLNYEITDFTMGSDTIKANGVVSALNAANISDYASIAYNTIGDAVITFDSNGLAAAGGDVYTVLLTDVKSATLSQVFSYTELSSTISWGNIGSDDIIDKSDIFTHSLAGVVTNPGDILGLQIESIIFASLAGVQTVLDSSLPTISNSGVWSLIHTDMPLLADGKYTVTVNFIGNNGYSKSISNAKPVIVDTVEPSISHAMLEGSTVILTMDEYLNGASVPDASTFSVSGSTIDSVAIEGKKVVLTLSTAIIDTVAVSYTKPSIGNVLEDTVGNDVASMNNVFVGTSGINTILGTSTDDVIIGNAGIDTLMGNGGSDTFDYNTILDGHDVITDFTIGNGEEADKLNFTDLLHYSSTDTLADFLAFTHTGTDVMVNLDIDGSNNFENPDLTLTLSNMGTVTLDLSDFVDHNLVVL